HVTLPQTRQPRSSVSLFPTHHRCLALFYGVPYAPSWSLDSVRLPVFDSEEVKAPMKRSASFAHKFLGCEEHFLMSRLVRLFCISFLAISPCAAQQAAPPAAAPAATPAAAPVAAAP